MHYRTCNKILEKLLDAQRKLEDARQDVLVNGNDTVYLHVSMALRSLVKAQEAVREARTR